MHSIQTFPTMVDAESEQSKMRGWNTEILESEREGFDPDDYDENGELKTEYTICCNGNKWLCEDGYVR